MNKLVAGLVAVATVIGIYEISKLGSTEDNTTTTTTTEMTDGIDEMANLMMAMMMGDQPEMDIPSTTSDHPTGRGQVIIDQLSSDFKWLPVKKKGVWTMEHRTQMRTPLMRPYVYPQDQIDECIRCLNGTGLSFFLAYFGEESLMPNLCVGAGMLRRADLETMIFGSYVCSARPFTDEELIQDCVSSHLPFAYSPLRLGCGTGTW
jgi:hypothetical protein